MSTATTGRTREYRVEWRALPQLPGYEIGSDGTIRSFIPWKGTPIPRTLKVFPNKDGYLSTALRFADGRRTAWVHVLVAEVFLGPRPEGLMVCHWNGDPSDNRVSNLRYAARRENSMDSLRHGTHFPGSLTHCAKGGHPLAGANLYVSRNGKRMCRACSADRARRRRLRMKGQS